MRFGKLFYTIPGMLPFYGGLFIPVTRAAPFKVPVVMSYKEGL